MLLINGAAQRQRIDIKTDLIFQICVVATCYRRTQYDVGLTSVSAQQCFDNRLESHQHTTVGLAADGFQPISEVRPQCNRLGSSRRIKYLWSGIVSSQLQHWNLISVLVKPILTMTVHVRIFQRIQLPGCIVFVLQGQRLRLHYTVKYVAAQFIKQHIHGPTVRDNVVHVEQEQVPVFSNADQ